MADQTPADQHAAGMRSVLLHRRANRRQERAQLVKGPERIAEIDAELVLIETDLARYGHVEPESI